MNLPLHLATRFLKSGKTQTFVIVLGIAVGVSVQVFIGSLITGLQKSLVSKTIGSSSQITISAPAGNYIDGYDAVVGELQTIDQIKVFSPTLDARGTLISGTETQPTTLRGFDFTKANQIYSFDTKLTEGVLPTSDGQIALGVTYQDAPLSLTTGSTIDLNIPLGGTKTFTVVGFFDMKVSALNSSWGITTLANVQDLLAVGNKVSSIETQIKDAYIFDAPTIAASIETTLNNDTFVVTNWVDNNQELLSGLQGQSISSLMIQVFVMISVVLGIASVLAIIVMQKSKQIGILKAMGLKDGDASLVFLYEGLILGILGAVLGVALGLGLSTAFTTFALKPDGSPVIPLFIDPAFIGLSGLIAIAAATLASLIPAGKSKKLSVIEVIRNA